MTDLSHWDFADTFHIEEAAELIVGGNPEAALGPRQKNITFSTAAKPVFNRMHEASVTAMLAMKGGQNCPPEGLMFLELERIALSSKPRTLLLSILDTMVSTGDEYRVRRGEIARWLSAIGMKSVYQFDRSKDSITPTAKVQPDADKPLAPRERDTLLNIIGALVELIQTAKPGRDSDAAVIKELLDNYSDKPGIKERTLQGKFAEAKRSLLSD